MKNEHKKYLIVIAGPTAVGKTKIAIEIAKHFNTEIISADSRQIFQELNIGVARPKEEELQQIKHHFIANKSIQEYISAGTYEKEVLEILDKIYEQKDIAVLCGGTGFYINAILYGFDEMPAINPKIREELNSILKEKGLEVLQQKLLERDKKSYCKIDIQNPQRVIRALEICIGTGQSFSSFKKQQQIKRNFIPIKIGLNLPKEQLYENINRRVDKMIQNGFIEEAKSVFNYKNTNALQTVGYNELFEVFDKKITLEAAVELIKLHTRQYAKRQITFFNKNKDYTWFQPKELQEILESINHILQN